MILDNESQVTEAVLAALAGTPDPRLRAVLTSLIRHLHAFLREARPSEEEYYAGLRFIAELGQHTDATAQRDDHRGRHAGHFHAGDAAQ